MNYQQFIESKRVDPLDYGFDPVWMPDFLFDFQIDIEKWILRRGRVAVFADCGLGKTPLQLVWSENIVCKTNGKVLILAPLAVSSQTVQEGEKFGIEVNNIRRNGIKKGINIINYEQLDKLKNSDFVGVVCDESSVIKHSDSKTRHAITEFLKPLQYRLLCTATPAPNDYMELGTSSEALGVMGRNQMLAMFFEHSGETTSQWNLKKHARKRFWQWMASWSRACRKPSDLGYVDGKFVLPPLNIEHHRIKSMTRLNQGQFYSTANTLDEQRKERRATLKKRCQKVADLVPKDRPVVIWAHLNDETDYLEKIIPDAVQVKGSQSEELKESRLIGFSNGDIRVLISKAKISGWGLNWQHCSDVISFPTYSHESWYQSIRRCWRFGQEKEVTVNLVYSEAERPVVTSMLRKEKQAVEMYEGIVRHMSEFYKDDGKVEQREIELELPEWLNEE